MCCCLAFGDTDLETAASTVTDVHACCHIEDQADPEKAEHSQDSGDCYHEESNLLKINDIGPDLFSNLADLLDHSSDYLAISSSQETYVSNLRKTSDYHSFETHSPGSRVSRAYCVFLL